MEHDRIGGDFFRQDVLTVAPALLGKKLVRVWPSGEITEHIITETEAYRGGEDLACHASRGLTPRTRVMFGPGGHLYMYLIYGMYWMLNVVTAEEGVPQAVLIRGLAEVNGPGRLTRKLELDGSFNGESLIRSARIFIGGTKEVPAYTCHPRIGIDYAGEEWANKPWRYVMEA